MASTGQGGKQRAQPMQRSSSIHATAGGGDRPFAGLSGVGRRRPQGEFGQRLDGGAAAGWALIDRRLAARDGGGVRLTAGIAAPRALRLWQQGVDARHIDLRLAAAAHLTRMPGLAPISGETTKISAPPGPAASIIPSEVPKRILRGSRFATTTMSRPTSDAGS